MTTLIILGCIALSALAIVGVIRFLDTQPRDDDPNDGWGTGV